MNIDHGVAAEGGESNDETADLVRALQVAWQRGGREELAALAGRDWLTLSDPSLAVAHQLGRLLLMDPDCEAVLIEVEEESADAA